MKTITLTSSDKKIDLLLQVAKEMGIKTKLHKKLTDEEMAMPGPKVTNEQLEEWLAEGDGEGGFTSTQMFKRLKESSAKTAAKSGSHL